MSESATDDAGLTLVELLVAMVLLVIVAAMVSGLLVNGFFSQQRVVNTTLSNTDSQTAAAAILYDVRYSQEQQISEGGAMLRTRTWVGEDGTSGQYVCRGWFYNTVDGTLRRAMGATSTAGATATGAASWPVFIENVSADSPFGIQDGGIRVAFMGEPDVRGVPTKMETVIVPRKQIESEVPACF